MAVERFEDLLVWQKARELARESFEASRLGTFERDWGLRYQLNRASASVSANIAEGFERGSRAEFAQFLSVAKGSSGEVRSHLYIALDRGHLDPPTFDRLFVLATDVARLVSALRTAVQRQRDAQRRKPSLSPES